MSNTLSPCMTRKPEEAVAVVKVAEDKAMEDVETRGMLVL